MPDLLTPEDRSETPLLGREALQRTLLSTLRGIGLERGLRVVILEGPDGLGKSALSAWLARSARKRGLAEVFEVWPAGNAGDARGLRDAFIRALRSRAPRGALGPEAVRAWLGEDDPFAVRGLSELLNPPHGGLPAESSPYQELLRALLRRSTPREAKPLLLRVEDVHKSAEVLRLLTWLCRGAEGMPQSAALVLITLRREGLSEECARELAILEQLARPQALVLQPLDDEVLREMLRPRLHDPGLRERVVLASDGSPLMARQLCFELIHRGPLTESQWPEDLDGLWRLRLDRSLGALPEDWRAGLELLVPLGGAVPFSWWWETCEEASLDCPAEAWSCFEENGLLLPSELPEAWAFAHPSLRRLLETGAEAARRWPRWALAAARVLARHGQDEGELGLLLTRAGAWRDSLAPLLRSAESRVHRGELRGAELLLTQRRTAMDALRLPYDDPLRAEGWLLDARIRHRQLQLPLARNIAERAERVARWADREDLRLRAQWELGLIARDTGDLALALSSLNQVERAFSADGDPLALAQVRTDLARVLFRLGAFEPAQLRYEQALEQHEALGLRLGAGNCRRGLGDIAVSWGDHILGERLLQEALVDFREAGSRLNAARCANSLGELARAQDDLAAAETWYRAAADAWRTDPEHRDPLPELNLALVLILRGRAVEAEPLLQDCLTLYIQRSQRGMIGATYVALLPGLAAREAWDDLEHHLREARALLSDTGLVDTDIGLCARLAADICHTKGATSLAQALELLALEQYMATDQAEAVEALRRR